jgi:hypothetical protein
VCDFSWPCNQTSAIYDKIACTHDYYFSLYIPFGSNVTEGFGLEVYDSVCAAANYAPAAAEEAALDWQVVGIAKMAVELKIGEGGNGKCDEQGCSWEVGADGNVLPVSFDFETWWLVGANGLLRSLMLQLLLVRDALQVEDVLRVL